MDNLHPSNIQEVLRTAALFPLQEARAEALRKHEGDTSLMFLAMGHIKHKLRLLETMDVMRACKRVSPTVLP